MVLELLCIFSATTLDASAFRIHRVESADNCQDHSVHFTTTFALAGEPVILKCPPFKYTPMDVVDLSLNVTWYKNDSTAITSAESNETRILSQGDALWFLPAILEDSAEYICTRRNASYCTDVSVLLTVVEKSAAHDISYPQTLFTFSPGKVVCPTLGDFVEKDPDYELKWYKDSAPLDTDNKKYIALKGTSCLIITSVSSSDSGYYICQMSFEHETAQYNITRIIQLHTLEQSRGSSPVIVYPNQKITLAVLGSHLTIPCKVYVGKSSEDFYTDVWWLANDTDIDEMYPKGRVREGQRKELVDNDENFIEVLLSFGSVEEVDFNTDFTCIARNSRGHQMQATQVQQEESEFSWYLAIIPATLAILIVGGIWTLHCWKRRSDRGYIVQPSRKEQILFLHQNKCSRIYPKILRNLLAHNKDDLKHFGV